MTANGETVRWGLHTDAAGGQRTCRTGDAQIFGYGDDYVQSDERRPMQDLALRTHEMGLDWAHIGVEMENYCYFALADAALRD